MKYFLIHILFIFSFVSILNADDLSTYIQTQYEIKDFQNSKQKTDGTAKTILLQQEIQNHTFKIGYEHADTTTKSPVPKNLKIDKISLRYFYKLNDKTKIYTGYINVDDNLVSTDGGDIYSAGMTYKILKPMSLDMTFYYGDYDIMKTYQVDAKLTYKHSFGDIKSKTILVAKQIDIQECEKGEICTNAKDSYFTPGFKQILSYKGYYTKVGAFFGQRVFAVMHDGFRVQHHAMEFDKTLMSSIGKKYKGLNMSVSYIYQEATELPSQTHDVKVKNIVLTLGYKF